MLSWLRQSPLFTAAWVDWLDIGLLAWLIYMGLMLLRGTRGIQSLLGLGILSIFYLLSDVVGLSAIHWVLDHLFVYIVIAMLILFQEDIRRALARAGGTLSARTSRPSDAHLKEEIIKAVFNLAPRKIGALIAIERTAALEPFIEGAQRIDAAVSAELLQSIFHPSSPLHDGAVVISDDRIRAVGVFLPLSLSKSISRAYGTRHRAAIGLTEEADAEVLVVSEERGTVSLVRAGVVIPIADANDLRRRLQEGMERGSNQPEELRTEGTHAS